MLTWDWQDNDQATVKAVLAHLQRDTTMAESVAPYFDLDDDAW